MTKEFSTDSRSFRGPDFLRRWVTGFVYFVGLLGFRVDRRGLADQARVVLLWRVGSGLVFTCRCFGFLQCGGQVFSEAVKDERKGWGAFRFWAC